MVALAKIIVLWAANSHLRRYRRLKKAVAMLLPIVPAQ
jgi:erythromycin esterase-like protein